MHPKTQVCQYVRSVVQLQERFLNMIDKLKIYYNDEDDLINFFCESINCRVEPTEANPVGCEGCNDLDDWLEEKYSEHLIDEQMRKEFISKDELFEYIDQELRYEKSQTRPFDKGFFHALKRIKSIIKYPEIKVDDGKEQNSS